MRWLAFSYSISSQPSSSSRVTLWRRLQKLGALALTGSYVLPEQVDCLESFTWLGQEIKSAGGEALIMKVEQFEGLSDKELINRFNQARAEAYAELLSEIEQFEASLKPKDAETQALKTLTKLRRRFSELSRIDFFDAPAGKEVAQKLTSLEQALSPQAPEAARVPVVDKKDYQGKTWVTRPKPHVDRLASAWLIKRFIDPKATIVYRSSAKKGELSFDMDDAHFGHSGSLCTFETLLLAFSLTDNSLTSLAQIIHEMDLRDERYLRSEVSALDLILDGWATLNLSDDELEHRGAQLFEALYASFSQS